MHRLFGRQVTGEDLWIVPAAVLLIVLYPLIMLISWIVRAIEDEERHDHDK